MGFPIEFNLNIDSLSGIQGDDHASNPVTSVVSGVVSGREGEAGNHEEPASVSPVVLSTGRWSRWIAIAGGFGYVPLAPGTAGSFAGVLLFGLMAFFGAWMGVVGSSFFWFYGLAVVVVLLLGIYAAGRAEIDFGQRDDGRIVIDEVLGQLITLVPLLPVALWMAQSMASPSLQPIRDSMGHPVASQADMIVFFLEVVTGFVLFRLFDVWKPGAIGWAERRLGGGLGVMADDVMAGLYAAVCLFGLRASVFEGFYSNPATWLGTLSGVKPIDLGAGIGVGIGVSL
ncbi:MAG: phosphatidylglycerophosphatase A [Myxococcales bacterium]|nr:phosphatidylglycerophosphatase A [Myxococcales bacterium]HIK85616.1 phosphatidylglycerophosphatase A [Myxococcales bacterium]